MSTFLWNVHTMAWHRQATSHYLSQFRPRSTSSYGHARPQWVNPFGADAGMFRENLVNTMVTDALVSCFTTLQWRHNNCDGVPNHRDLHYLPNCLFRCRSKKTPKLCISGLCERNPPVTGGFPSQRANNAENVSFNDVIMSHDIGYIV